MPRKTFTTLAAVWILAFPPLSAWGAVQSDNATTPRKKTAKPAAKPKKKVVTTKATVTGPTVKCKRWGDLVVRIKVKKTTTTIGTRKKVAIKILAIDFPVFPDATFRSHYINTQALPLLVEEVMEAQSAKVEVISGATDITVSFKQSLQAAILKAKT